MLQPTIYLIARSRKTIIATLMALLLWRVGYFVPAPFMFLNSSDYLTIAPAFPVLALGYSSWLLAITVFEMLSFIPCIRLWFGKSNSSNFDIYATPVMVATMLISLFQAWPLVQSVKSVYDSNGHQNVLLTLVPVLSLTAGALLMPLLSRFIDSFGSGIGLPIMIVGAAVIDIPESVQSVWNTYSIGQTTRILIACSLAIAVLMVVGAVAFFRWWTINRADSGTLFFNSILLAAVTSGWLLPLASFLFEPETLQFQGHAEVLAWYVPYALLSVIFLFVILPPQNFLMISAISAASLYLILEAFVDVLVPEFFTFTLLEVCALGLLVAAFMLAQHDTKITRGTANAFRKTQI